MTTIPGNTLNSIHADTTKNYRPKRYIATINKCDNISDEEIELLKRADGIIDALPADGYIQPEELVRLEDPFYSDSLFPQERNVILPGLWKYLEWNDSAAVAAASPIKRLADEDIRDISEEVKPVDISGEYDIASLAGQDSDQLKALKRIQLVHNRDADASTVSVKDLREAIAQPGRFKPNEIKLFEKTIEDIKIQQISQMPELEATVRIPKPGVKTTRIQNTGRLSIKIVSETKLMERHWRIEHIDRTFEHDIQLYRLNTAVINVPDGMCLEICDMNGRTLPNGMYGEGEHDIGELPTQIRTILRRNGRIVEERNLAIPEFKKTDVRNLNEYLGYQFVSRGNREVVPKRIIPNQNYTTNVEHKYLHPFETARYSFPLQYSNEVIDGTLQVYKNGVVKLSGIRNGVIPEQVFEAKWGTGFDNSSHNVTGLIRNGYLQPAVSYNEGKKWRKFLYGKIGGVPVKADINADAEKRVLDHYSFIE